MFPYFWQVLYIYICIIYVLYIIYIYVWKDIQMSTVIFHLYAICPVDVEKKGCWRRTHARLLSALLGYFNLILYDERVMQPAHLCNLEVLYTRIQTHIFTWMHIYIYIYTVLPMDIVWSPTRAWKSKTVTEQFMYCTLKASPNTSVPYSRAWTTVLYAFRIRFLCVQWSVSSATSLIVVCLFLHFLHVPTFSELHFTAILEDGAIFNI